MYKFKEFCQIVPIYLFKWLIFYPSVLRSTVKNFGNFCKPPQWDVQEKLKNWGNFIIGFAVLFIGLQFLKDAVPDIKSNPEILAFVSRYTDLGFLSVLLFMFIGTLLTVIIQSSIVRSLFKRHLYDLIQAPIVRSLFKFQLFDLIQTSTLRSLFKRQLYGHNLSVIC